LRRSTTEGAKVCLTVVDPKVVVAVVKTRERGVSRAFLAAAVRSMRTAFAAPLGLAQSPKSPLDPTQLYNVHLGELQNVYNYCTIKGF
jgi:hypothetical protein